MELSSFISLRFYSILAEPFIEWYSVFPHFDFHSIFIKTSFDWTAQSLSHYPLHLEEKTVGGVSVSILSPLCVCLAALQFWIWIIIENQSVSRQWDCSCMMTCLPVQCAGSDNVTPWQHDHMSCQYVTIQKSSSYKIEYQDQDKYSQRVQQGEMPKECEIVCQWYILFTLYTNISLSLSASTKCSLLQIWAKGAPNPQPL